MLGRTPPQILTPPLDPPTHTSLWRIANLGATGTQKKFFFSGERVGKLVPSNVFIPKMLKFER